MGRSLDALIEDALRAVLAPRLLNDGHRRVELPSFSGGRLLAGVDLDHSSEVLSVMEESNAE
jgi:hypothetical protein